MAVRRLSEITAPATISEGSPLDLDLFNLQAGDDITLLLTDIVTRYGAVYVRAPSKTVGVVCATVQPTITDSSFVFLEDESAANKLTITHTPENPTGAVTLWNGYTAQQKHLQWGLTNALYVKIGGPNLSISFVGTHPGLGTGDDTVAGHLTMTTGPTGTRYPSLADIRANFKNTHGQGVMFFGGAGVESLVNRVAQVNIAGTFNNSGVSVPDGGVYDIWFDPDRTVVMDPYARVMGWNGTSDYTRGDGLELGCVLEARWQWRAGPQASVIFANRVRGGVTFEYGTPNANLFECKYLGESASAPFIVRYSDYGRSGPTVITGRPEGVAVKKSADLTIMKHDPMTAYGHTAADFRWLRFHELPSTFGMGVSTETMAYCAEVTGPTSQAVVWRAEASSPGGGYVTAYVDVSIVGGTQWKNSDGDTGFFQAWKASEQNATDSSFGHVVRVTGGTIAYGTVFVLDRCTVTGPGRFTNIATAVTTQKNPDSNTITATYVDGKVTIGDNATGTVISNVNFWGTAARQILVIGTGSDVALSNLTVRAGSTITRSGTGSATLDGSPLTFTANVYTFPGALTAATVPANGRPNAPSGGSVS
jgi:hypothetical protein